MDISRCFYFAGDASEYISLFPKEIKAFLISRGNKDILISRGNKDILISRGNKLIKSDNKVIWRGNKKGFLLQTAFHTTEMSCTEYVPYTAKLSRGETFAVGIEKDRSRENVRGSSISQ